MLKSAIICFEKWPILQEDIKIALLFNRAWDAKACDKFLSLRKWQKREVLND